ncbi:RAB44 protein, partial [Todus mexicanus]|nr:RAB44 protein [Todus mexicanus]
MWIKPGAQSNEPKAKSTHHVVWEMLPAETSLAGAAPRGSSREDDSLPEFLKEERFSDQSSLLREMNDAIAALTKQLKQQAPNAAPTLEATARHPQDGAEPHTGLEAATAPGTTPRVLQETVPGHVVGHELLEGDLQEGPAAAELRAPDVTQDDVLQEQVSALAAKTKLHTASQQLEKPPRVTEAEQIAAGPAEHPKQEVPPASTLHVSVQQKEDAGNDLSGTVLGDSSLGDAANSSVQPPRQLLGQQNEDLSVSQQEKKQEAGQKMSREGKPSPGEPGTMTADGTGAALGGSPEASLEPDHLYNVLFIGDSHVGKTSFLYRLHADTFNPHLTATVG